jgi:hypothetical protein
MKKSLIAAAFGGVLASGFLTVSTPVAHAPVAHADECSDVYGPNGKFPWPGGYDGCEQIKAHPSAPGGRICFDPNNPDPRLAGDCIGGGAPGNQAPIGGPMCDEASKHTGIKCPGQN